MFVALALLLCVAAPLHAAEPAAPTVAFLKAHCTRCHGAEKPQGKFALHTFGERVGDHRAGYAAILERLRAGDMPPADEPQPDATSVKRAISRIEAGLADKSTTETVNEASTRPNEGNRVPHALLFGVAAREVTPPLPRLWRLSPQNYADGFVGGVRGGPKDLARPFDLIAEPGIRDFAALYAIDTPGTEVLLRNAQRIVEGQTAHKIVEDEKGSRVQMGNDTISAFAPLLDPKQPPTRDQLVKAIQAQYAVALLRPATDDEVSRLLALYEKNLKVADRVGAVRATLMAPLLSAEAMYRFELGSGPEVRPGVRSLSPRETAFAVNLALMDRRDNSLFDAANKGGLATREDVAKHVRRLLDEPKVNKTRLLGFFREYFGYDAAVDVFKDRPKDLMHRPEILVRDTDRLVQTIIDEDRDVLVQMLTTDRTFANYTTSEDKATRKQVPKPAVIPNPYNDKGCSAPEAAYGFSEWPTQQPAKLPAGRIGVLMQPAWLIATTGNFDNDPVRRGRWVRERLLGGQVPDLPIGVVAKVPDEPHETLRTRFRVTREAVCWKCHQKMDDLGLPFEQFEHYGRWRTAEKVLDTEATEKNVDKNRKPLGPVMRDATLNTAGVIAQSGDAKIDGPVKDATELVTRLASSERVRQVFVRHSFRYYLGRNETPGDAKTLQEADRAYVESGGSFRALLVSLLSSESFLYRKTASQ